MKTQRGEVLEIMSGQTSGLTPGCPLSFISADTGISAHHRQCLLPHSERSVNYTVVGLNEIV